MDRLKGKVAIITGATSGIGEGTARRFVAEGALVLLAGRSVERGEALVRELGSATAFQRADILCEADIAALADGALKRFGRLDCFFNNAGGVSRGDLDTVTEEEFDYSMKLLVGSVVFGIKHAARIMAPQGSGSILINSSIAAHRTGQGGYLYSAAKAAVSHLTRVAGAQLGAYGVRVNAISPGAVPTPIFWGGSGRADTLSAEDNQRKRNKLESILSRATSLPRSGHVDDVANAAVYLASDEGSFINCHDLVVDGGRIALFHERPAEA